MRLSCTLTVGTDCRRNRPANKTRIESLCAVFEGKIADISPMRNKI
jgi:hypothetical protein